MINGRMLLATLLLLLSILSILMAAKLDKRHTEADEESDKGGKKAIINQSFHFKKWMKWIGFCGFIASIGVFLSPWLMPRLQVGDKAPYFEGTDERGNTVRLSDFQGKKLVLYFYPKDDTPSCTKQARHLRDSYQKLLDKGYALVGVSNDSVDSHKKFVEKHNLPFPLIADTDRTITKAYRTTGLLWFSRRITFVIDEKGEIQDIIKAVKVTEHVNQILKTSKE